MQFLVLFDVNITITMEITAVQCSICFYAEHDNQTILVHRY